MSMRDQEDSDTLREMNAHVFKCFLRTVTTNRERFRRMLSCESHVTKLAIALGIASCNTGDGSQREPGRPLTAPAVSPVPSVSDAFAAPEQARRRGAARDASASGLARSGGAP
jgi:hypothetical protein